MCTKCCAYEGASPFVRKCIRAGINCLLMNMCREFDLIFQM